MVLYRIQGGDTVQNPPPGLFNSDDLQWTQLEDIDALPGCYIPTRRLQDFVTGEGKRPETECLFKISSKDIPKRKSRTTIRYWCSYGPKDLRDMIGQDELPADYKPPKSGPGSRPHARRKLLGLSCHRGCQCHFSATIFKDRPDDCLIRWDERKHADKNGKVCHGIMDPTARRANAHIAHKLSRDCLEFVRQLLQSGLAPTQVMIKFERELRDRARAVDESMWSRDMQLSLKDIYNVHNLMRKASKSSFDSDALQPPANSMEDHHKLRAKQMPAVTTTALSQCPLSYSFV